MRKTFLYKYTKYKNTRDITTIALFAPVNICKKNVNNCEKLNS